MPAPTLNDLKAFAAVSAHRSFRKAADELGLSASSLSHVVRTLDVNFQEVVHSIRTGNADVAKPQ